MRLNQGGDVQSTNLGNLNHKSSCLNRSQPAEVKKALSGEHTFCTGMCFY